MHIVDVKPAEDEVFYLTGVLGINVDSASCSCVVAWVCNFEILHDDVRCAQEQDTA